MTGYYTALVEAALGPRRPWGLEAVRARQKVVVRSSNSNPRRRSSAWWSKSGTSVVNPWHVIGVRSVDAQPVGRPLLLVCGATGAKPQPRDLLLAVQHCGCAVLALGGWDGFAWGVWSWDLIGKLVVNKL